MKDFLNNPEYSRYWDKFRKQCKQKYAATEIAFILRGLSDEPELLERCSERNVAMIKNIHERETHERQQS